MKRLLVFLGLGAAARFLLKRRIDDDAVHAPRSFAPPPVPPAPAAKPAEPEPPVDEPEPPVAEPEPDPDPQTDADVPYGPGSAPTNEDGSPPEGFTIKGKTASRLYHTAESPYYKRTRADVWFREESDAEGAGFRRWDAKRKG